MNAQLQPRNGVLTKFLKARPFPFPYTYAVEKICGDYRATVNPCLHVQQHHIPRIEELFAKLQGGVQLIKLDMRYAYLQFELVNETKQLLVTNTHNKGLH